MKQATRKISLLLFALLLFQDLPGWAQTALICVQIAVTLLSFALYARYYHGAWKRVKKSA